MIQKRGFWITPMRKAIAGARLNRRTFERRLASTLRQLSNLQRTRRGA